jgi:hypothetical protein
MLLPSSLRWLGQFTLTAALLCLLAYGGLDHPLASWITHYPNGWQAPVATLTSLLDAVVQGLLVYLHGLLMLVVLSLGAQVLARRPFFTLLLTMVLLRASSEISASLLKSFVHESMLPAIQNNRSCLIK